LNKFEIWSPSRLVDVKRHTPEDFVEGAKELGL